MIITPAQLVVLKVHIDASNDLNIFPNNSDGAFEIAKLLNLTASPDYFVWRSNVTRIEVYNTTSLDSTNWDWTVYKNQGITEQGAWREMFMGDEADFGKVNLRAGIGKIFTGSAPANAQRDHALAIGRRKATRAEQLYSVAVVSPPANTGNTGSTRGASVNPDVLVFEGTVTGSNVDEARAL